MGYVGKKSEVIEFARAAETEGVENWGSLSTLFFFLFLFQVWVWMGGDLIGSELNDRKGLVDLLLITMSSLYSVL